MEDPATDVLLQRIDAQHSRLLRILKEISEARLVRAGHPVTLVLLEGLRELLLEHFRDEEAFMELIGYTELSGHKWQHDILLNDFLRIEADVRAGKRELSLEDLRELGAIVHDHTNESDVLLFTPGRG